MSQEKLPQSKEVSTPEKLTWVRNSETELSEIALLSPEVQSLARYDLTRSLLSYYMNYHPDSYRSRIYRINKNLFSVARGQSLANPGIIPDPRSELHGETAEKYIAMFRIFAQTVESLSAPKESVTIEREKHIKLLLDEIEHKHKDGPQKIITHFADHFGIEIRDERSI